MSQAQEVAQGREAHPQVLAEFGRVDNPDLQGYLDQVGQSLAAVSHRAQLEWHFAVVDVPVINAFALPGGYIYFTRAILSYMNSEAELAGVMGHEIGHVTARHAVSQMSQAQLLGVGLGLGNVFSSNFYRFSDLAQFGVGLLTLKHSRDDEHQSDQLGIGYMSAAGYDPRRMSDFFVVFQRLRGEVNQSLPGWLSTHPDPANRVTDTAQEGRRMVQRNPGRDWKVGREDFLRRIQGLLFGANPREGFQEEGWFLHPDLRFKLRFPSGWRVQNSKQAVVAASSEGQSIIRLTLGQAPTGTSPEQYARQVARQPGVQLLDGQSTSIAGSPAFLGLYQISDPSQGGVLNALAAFIEFRGRLYEITGVAPVDIFREYSNEIRDCLTSFSQLSDQGALNIQPDRLDIYTVRKQVTLRDINDNMNNPRVSLDTLSLLNRIDPDEPIKAGSLVKVVRPGQR